MGAVFISVSRSPNAFASVDIADRPLFRLDGGLDIQVVYALLDAVEENDRGAVFRLFPDIGEGHALALSQTQFRFVNVVNGQVILWATTSYRRSTFDSLSHGQNHGCGTLAGTYALSSVRLNLIEDFSVIQDVIPNVNNILATKNSDPIWIPSRYEVADGGTWGFSNNSERAHSETGNLWLRDFYPEWGEGMGGLNSISHTGSVTAQMHTANNFVRPAVYIPLMSVVHGAIDYYRDAMADYRERYNARTHELNDERIRLNGIITGLEEERDALLGRIGGYLYQIERDAETIDELRDLVEELMQQRDDKYALIKNYYRPKYDAVRMELGDLLGDLFSLQERYEELRRNFYRQQEEIYELNNQSNNRNTFLVIGAVLVTFGVLIPVSMALMFVKRKSKAQKTVAI